MPQTRANNSMKTVLTGFNFYNVALIERWSQAIAAAN